MASVGADVGEVPTDEQTMFVRKATGLVRGWSARDGFIYAALSVNVVLLGLYIFSFGPFIPDGSLLWSVALGGAWLLLQVVTYGALIAAMPRAGGDYVWISRVLGGGAGFVLAMTGWWFIQWLWAPINANIVAIMVLGPLSTIAGWQGGGTFWGSSDGVFITAVLYVLLASFFVKLGMRRYARIQRICFFGGVIGLAVMIITLLVNSKTGFIAAFDSQAQDLYGVDDAYAKTLAAGTDGYAVPGLAAFAVGSTFALIPMMAFFNMWSNWGATLYGEVRGASDFRKNVYAMGGALIATTVAAIVLLLLFAKTFGWDFYNAANNAYWAGTLPTGAWPYPGTLVAGFFGNPVLEFIFVAVLALWAVGYVGTLYLSSSRAIFAAAFDRVLPETVARVGPNGVPYVALALLMIPALGISALYSYNSTFAGYTLAGTVVIAVTFLGSAIAAAVLPYRRPALYNASPIARYRVAGIPLITVAASVFIAFLVFSLYKWLTDDVYGINDTSSLIYIGAMYALAAAIYAGARIVRRRQGMELELVYGEVPAE